MWHTQTSFNFNTFLQLFHKILRDDKITYLYLLHYTNCRHNTRCRLPRTRSYHPRSIPPRCFPLYSYMSIIMPRKQLTFIGVGRFVLIFFYLYLMRNLFLSKQLSCQMIINVFLVMALSVFSRQEWCKLVHSCSFSKLISVSLWC